MGLVYTDVKHLVELRRGKTGGAALTLGRLTVYLHPSDIKRLRQVIGSDEQSTRWLDGYQWGQYAEGMFTSVLRYAQADSLDFSDYEGATFVHDIGDPLPESLMEKYDLVVDGGTLEHVFNLPVAVANMMRLAKQDGYVYWHGPCNNLAGHGFYQFSPELMYRLFSDDNGFEMQFVRVAQARQISIELTTNHKVYDVADPSVSGRRVNILGSAPVIIMTLAKRVRVCEPFSAKVLQSDYVTKWANEEEDGRGVLQRARELLTRNREKPWASALIGAYTKRKASLRGGANFTRRK